MRIRFLHIHFMNLLRVFCVAKITQAGGVAAPIGSQVFGEILPYLEVKKDNEEGEEKQEVEVPNLIGMSLKEAKQALTDLGLEIEVKENEVSEQAKEDGTDQNAESGTDGENNTTKDVITKQLPKAGIRIKQGTSIIVYQD